MKEKKKMSLTLLESLRIASAKPLTALTLAKARNMNYWTAWRHLAQLEADGYVETTKMGRTVYYKLRGE